MHHSISAINDLLIAEQKITTFSVLAATQVRLVITAKEVKLSRLTFLLLSVIHAWLSFRNISVALPGVSCADLPLRNEYKLKLEYLFFRLLFCKFLGLCSVLSPCVCLFVYVCGLDLNSQQAFAATDGRSDCKSFPHVQRFTHAATTA